MQMDFEVGNSGGGRNSAATQPLVPQLNRLKWEQEWLAENNKAFSVIDGNPSSTLSVTSINAAMPISLNRVVDRVQDVQAARPTATEMRSLTETVRTTSALPQVSGAESRRFDFYAIGEVALPPNNKLSNNALLASDMILQSAIETRRTLRNFAWWRNGDDVAVAMRVTPETDHIDNVLRTLRHWLKESGMNLLSVVVNGKMRK